MQARHTLSGQNKQKTNSETAKLYKERNKKKMMRTRLQLIKNGDRKLHIFRLIQEM